jgi:hypothetical protein
MVMSDNEQLIQDIANRLESIGEQVSEERLRGVVNGMLLEILEDDNSEFARKMRFGSAPSRLVGTKYARYGLSVADIEFAYLLLSEAQRVGESTHGPSEELRRTMGAISEAYIAPQADVRKMDKRMLDDYFRYHVSPSWLNAEDAHKYRLGRWEDTGAYQAAYRAMDTAESGYGSQLIGAQYVGELWAAARSESRVFALIDSFEMSAPTAYLPVEADLPEMLYVSENTSATASDYATTKTGSNRVTVTAAKFIIHQMWSGEMEEDSIIPFIPYLRRQTVLSLAHYSDSLVLNGDTTNAGTGNINLDDADPADTKHYLAFDGIRHIAITDNTNNRVIRRVRRIWCT